MTAIKMFHNLDYNMLESDSSLNYIKNNKTLMEKQVIKFNKELKTVELVKLIFNERTGLFKCRDDFQTKDYQVFTAIQKQIEELGWLK